MLLKPVTSLISSRAYFFTTPPSKCAFFFKGWKQQFDKVHSQHKVQFAFNHISWASSEDGVAHFSWRWHIDKYGESRCSVCFERLHFEIKLKFNSIINNSIIHFQNFMIILYILPVFSNTIIHFIISYLLS